MSEIKVNKISPRTNCGTVQLGDSGDTITIPAGATITNSGTQTGFGRTGTVNWDTTAKTAGFTGVSGNGYFINTTSGAITVNLPASPSAGDIMAIGDYAGTADTNTITVGRNGSNINGAASDFDITKENSVGMFVYIDGTQGWKLTTTANPNDVETAPLYVTASGGSEAISGDFKIHTFTGPGTFQVTCGGNAIGSNTVDYLVVAGGGSGGYANGGGGGGGAGGLMYSASTYCNPSPSGGAAGSALPVSAQDYPIAVGGGGGAKSGSPSYKRGDSGSNSSFSTITAHGGGGGGGGCSCSNQTGGNGGSGGGGGKDAPSSAAGGSGNTPPVSPSQGNPGGTGGGPGPLNNMGGGGGGHAQTGNNAVPAGAGAGGNGSVVAINGSSSAYAGGGGGNNEPGPVQGAGGSGGGGAGGAPGNNGNAGSANTGGGGGGIDSIPGSYNSGAGGSGIVIVRYKFQNQ